MKGRRMFSAYRSPVGTISTCALLLSLPLLLACTPRVEVAAPEKPITINLNIKLDANVRVQLEEAANKDIKENPELF